MSKIVLYGTELSPPVRSVLLTVNAIGLDIDFKEVSLMSGEHMSEEYQRKNPQHTVPLLDDNGKTVWDSHAIITYLIDKYAKNDSLYPKDLHKRAKIDQRLHFDSGILFPQLRGIVQGILRQNATEITQQQKDGVYQAYDFLEKFLESDSFLVGNSLTAADLSCTGTVTTLHGLVPIDAGKYPKLLKWIDRMTQLPYYEKANGVGVTKLVAIVSSKLTANN